MSCINCNNLRSQTAQTMLDYIVCDDFLQTYTSWYHHGESLPGNVNNQTRNIVVKNMHEMINDIFNMHGDA